MNGVVVCLCLSATVACLASAYPTPVDTRCGTFSNSNVTKLRDSLYQMSLDVDTLNVNYYLPKRCKCGDQCSDACLYEPTGIDPYFNYHSDVDDATCWIASISLRTRLYLDNQTLGKYEDDLRKLWLEEEEFDKLGNGLVDVIDRINNLITDLNEAVIKLSCMMDLEKIGEIQMKDPSQSDKVNQSAGVSISCCHHSNVLQELGIVARRVYNDLQDWHYVRDSDSRRTAIGMCPQTVEV